MDNIIDVDIDSNIRELATYIVSSAPIDVVKTFSIDFLIQSFKDDPDTFNTTWIEYQNQLQSLKKGNTAQTSNIIKFPQQGQQNVI